MISRQSRFSVLMSIYDGESPVRFYASLKSLLQQERKADEVVIVKDGAINSSLESVLSSFSAALPIRTVALKANIGLAGALNEGLKACSHDLVARMDTDDIALPNRFRLQVQFMENSPEVDIVGSWALDVDESGAVMRIRKVPVDHRTIVDLVWACPIIHPTVLFRRKRILEIGAYSTDAYRAEDYDLWFRAAQQHLVFANVPKALIKYTVKRQKKWSASMKQGWHRSRVGWRNALKSRLSLGAYLGISFYFIKSFIPSSLQKKFLSLSSVIDPRAR